MKIAVEKTKNFTVMSNCHLRDKSLSLKAKGLLSIMLSLPADWDYTVSGLCAICAEKETAITNALRELKESKYLIVKKLMPNETMSGKIEYQYIIYEVPQTKQDIEKQGIDFQGVENQGIEKQGAENLGLDILNTNNKILNNKILNNNIPPISPQKHPENVKEIIDYLNLKTGKKFNIKTASTSRHIIARLNEGYTTDDFKTVIDRKTAQWKGDCQMARFLRPETLFGNKFDGYLNEIDAPKSYQALKSEAFDLAEWERTHDEFGNPIDGGTS